MRIEHPADVPPAAVDVNGRRSPVDEDGTFGVPDDARSWLERFAATHDVDADELLAPPDDSGEGTSDEPGDTVCSCDPGEACDRCGGDCPTVKNDGEVCGRDLPCPYHSED